MNTYLAFITIRNGPVGLVEWNVCTPMLKRREGFNVSRNKIKKWLMKQDTYTLHKPIRRHFKRNRVIVGGIDQQWQMDLADVQALHEI